MVRNLIAAGAVRRCKSISENALRDRFCAKNILAAASSSSRRLFPSKPASCTQMKYLTIVHGNVPCQCRWASMVAHSIPPRSHCAVSYPMIRSRSYGIRNYGRIKKVCVCKACLPEQVSEQIRAAHVTTKCTGVCASRLLCSFDSPAKLQDGLAKPSGWLIQACVELILLYTAGVPSVPENKLHHITQTVGTTQRILLVKHDVLPLGGVAQLHMTAVHCLTAHAWHEFASLKGVATT